jgi:hypothetical protein
VNVPVPDQKDRRMTMAIEDKRKVRGESDQRRIEHRRAKPTATIQSWAVVDTVLWHSFAALQAGNRLTGHVSGLPHVPYGKPAYTSPIVRVDPAHGLVETRNTIYRLGEISEAYGCWRGARH